MNEIKMNSTIYNVLQLKLKLKNNPMVIIIIIKLISVSCFYSSYYNTCIIHLSISTKHDKEK